MDNYQPNQTCYCTRCRSRGIDGPGGADHAWRALHAERIRSGAFSHNTWPILLIVIGLVKVLAGNSHHRAYGRDRAGLERHPRQPRILNRGKLTMSSPAPQIHVHRRRSLAGPMVLILIGVILLLGNMHYLRWQSLHHYFALYWPALLILWGVVKLLEHWQDSRAGVPSRGIGAGGVVLMIFLVLFGMGFTASDRVNWNALRGQMDIDDDFGGLFGNSYNFSATVEQPFAAGSDLKVVSDRGDVVVNTWAEPKIKVVVRKKVVADNEEQGKKIDGETQPTFTTAGTTVTLNANTGGAGNNAVASDLEIYVPQKANVEVSDPAWRHPHCRTRRQHHHQLAWRRHGCRQRRQRQHQPAPRQRARHQYQGRRQRGRPRGRYQHQRCQRGGAPQRRLLRTDDPGEGGQGRQLPFRRPTCRWRDWTAI